MVRPQQYFDWHALVDEHSDDEPVANTRDRLRWVLGFFAFALAVIMGRAVQLELTGGHRFRQLAAQPLERTVPLRAERGRILARDGTVLAADRQTTALAVQFRYLETPPDAAWLRRLARSRLPRAERRKPERVAAMEEVLRGELVELHERLAKLCRLSLPQWQARAGRIQRRVASLAAHVNEKRLEQYQDRLLAEQAASELNLATVIAGLFAPPENLPPAPLVVAEQAGYHRIVDDVTTEVVREIEQRPEQYPGVKIAQTTRREYPQGSLAAHLVGHVGVRAGISSLESPSGRTDVDEPPGLMGLERLCEPTLRGQPGLERQTTDHRGKLLSTHVERELIAGQDVTLTIDAQLQTSAEQLLDRAMRRRERAAEDTAESLHGGAIVVIDVHSGEILAAASAPRFDPNLFAAGDPRLESLLADPRQPLFDRVTKMAIPPGSVFKPLTALALLANHTVEPTQVFCCQGYLHDPDHERCQIFRQHGIGHGDVVLADALAQSCNVYFFHHAHDLGSTALLDWSDRLGFGQKTGIDMSDEAAGQLPTIEQLRQASQAHALAIGQGAFTATPLQVVRLYAAIANGGYLLTPRVVRNTPQGDSTRSADSRIAELTPEALDAVREGLRRVVEDPNGTAYVTVRMESLAIAGKTGTAETGGRQPDHAWFAGYAPADAPRVAFAVVLEHAGSGATAAGSVAKSLLQRMQQLGYFAAPETAEKPIPPGKG